MIAPNVAIAYGSVAVSIRKRRIAGPCCSPAGVIYNDAARAVRGGLPHDAWGGVKAHRSVCRACARAEDDMAADRRVARAPAHPSGLAAVAADAMDAVGETNARGEAAHVRDSDSRVRPSAGLDGRVWRGSADGVGRQAHAPRAPGALHLARCARLAALQRRSFASRARISARNANRGGGARSDAA